MERAVVPVVLSGGSGTRLWPASRPQEPKQLLAMLDERTMLQTTLARLEGVAHLAPPLVVCNVDHRHMVEEQLEGTDTRLVLEPVGRNTAPAAAAAAMVLTAGGSDPIMLVLPADHVIVDELAYRAAVDVAIGLAAAGDLAVFGVTPGYPETGYGYIRAGDTVEGGARAVDAFVEKPDLAAAQAYMAEGHYLWNSGMFVFRASAYLAELDRWAPDIVEAVRRSLPDLDESGPAVELDPHAFGTCRSDSIDFAVMEHTERAVVVTLDAGWSDVGSWSALWGVAAKDADGNVMVGDVIATNVRESYLRADSRLLAVAGIAHVIVVESADAVLVVPMDHAQQVKDLVVELQDAERREAQHHAARREPWGRVEAIAAGDGYVVGRVEVAAGAKVSLQPHHDRAEEWIVVAGTGVAEVDGRVVKLSAGTTVTVPPGTRHGMENRGQAPLVVIEVALGGAIDQEHIERPDDGRVGR